MPLHSDRPLTATALHRPAPGPGWLGALGAALALAAGLILAAPAAAQSPFSAAVYVNDQAITHYEVEQRARFMQFIGSSSAPDRDAALENLIDERLQAFEIRRAGVRLTPDGIQAGLAEFASRGDLTPDEFLAAIREAGIDRQTVEDFIRNGLAWRELIRGRFGAEVRITEAQIDHALAVEAVRPVTEIQISEIFLPSDPQFQQVVQPLIPQIQAINSIETFATAARQYSAGQTRETGGRVDRWIPIETIPEPMRSLMADARVAQVLGPIELPGAYAFFQLRARREARDVPAGQIELEYRRVGLPGGLSEGNLQRVARIRALSDGCASFPAAVGQAAPELPAEAIATITRRQNALPAATAAELGRLNPGQVSANLVESGELAVLMLCARRVATDPAPSREQVQVALIDRALEGRAEAFLRTLRAEAEIRRP